MKKLKGLKLQQLTESGVFADLVFIEKDEDDTEITQEIVSNALEDLYKQLFKGKENFYLMIENELVFVGNVKNKTLKLEAVYEETE